MNPVPHSTVRPSSFAVGSNGALSDTLGPAPLTWSVETCRVQDHMINPSVEYLLNRDQAAAKLNVSVSSLDRLVRAGKGLPTVSIGRRRLFPSGALDEWIRQEAVNTSCPRRVGRPTKREQMARRRLQSEAKPL